ncbi:MAG: DMT family transporter [Oscillospiraceae bacterium]|nr:DMT family transporter [Oscillospiraceae bacterium]
MIKHLRGNILLLITALIWGTAFVAQSEGMNHVGPFTYNAMRTLLGGIVLIPVIAGFRRFGKSERTEKAPLRVTVTGGVVCGILLCVASSFQQSGISMTTAGKAGFITALYIIIVPILEFLLFRRSNPVVWISVLIAAGGFWLLCIKEGFTVGKGDWLVLCCALFFAMHIMVIDHFNAKHADAMLMSCIQFFTAGILMLICMFLFETPSLSSIFDARYTILYAGIMSSGVAYTLQILGQRDTEPAAATLLMSLESVFAALSGWLILHEALTLKELIGCALVFAAVLLAQLKAPQEKTSKGETS